jgi:multiple sugar transport system substrate-binding protein
MVHLARQSTPGRRLAAAAAVAVTVTSVLAACSGSSGSSGSSSGSGATAVSKCPAPGTINKSLSGTTVNFLMPPWGDMGKAEFQKFTDRTGIKVNLQTLPFDQVHDKTVAAMAAGTPPADLMEVDSLWVGQYVAAGWLEPVAKYVAPKTLSTVSAKANFTINNTLYGMPWVVDFRWTAAANMTFLQKAGVTAEPKTWADIKTDAQMLQAKGVLKYPVAMELDVEATTAEPWLTLLVSAGGTLLDAKGKPTFTDPNSAGYKAAEFLRSLYAAGLINPGSVNLSGDEAIQQFAGGQAAFGIPSGPGIISTETAKTAKVANDQVVGLLAGPNGVATSAYGLPESLGIPVNAKNKCGASMLLAWWNETPQEVFRYTQPAGGSFPAQQQAIDQVLANQKPAIAQSIKAVLPSIKPLFVNGAPTWYPSFANDMATTLQAVILGHISVAAGMNTLAKQALALEKKS